MQTRLWHKSYASGVDISPPFESVTISNALSRAANIFPGKTALNYMGRRISFRELDGLVNSFARGLASIGVSTGSKVAVCLPNIPQAVIANLAILRIGAVTIQNNPLLTDRELEYQLSDSEAQVVVTLSVLIDRMEKLKLKTRIEKIIGCHMHSFMPFPRQLLFPSIKKQLHRPIKVTDSRLAFEDLIAGHRGKAIKDCSRWEALAALIYTGGTTGSSRGVMLSNANLSSNVQQFVAWLPDWASGEESLVGTYPIFHTAGFSFVQNFTIWKAFEHIMVPKPEAHTLISILQTHAPSLVPGVPTLFISLMAETEFRALDLAFVKGFFSGAAPLAEDTIAQFRSLTGSPLCEVYGLTEASPLVAATPWGGRIKPGTVGVPIPHTDVRIVDLETGKRELDTGEAGEITVKGPQVMMGYFNRPNETRNVIRDGWLHTGDIGRFDTDGYLTIVDRIKDVIIAGGFNIYPVEIDAVLTSHPKIRDACAIGVPDAYRGETVKAFVVPQRGENLSPDEINTYCQERLAAYKIPKYIEFIDELPKSAAVGKVLRRQLREREMARKKVHLKQQDLNL